MPLHLTLPDIIFGLLILLVIMIAAVGLAKRD
jgi:hypothetical protein